MMKLPLKSSRILDKLTEGMTRVGDNHKFDNGGPGIVSTIDGRVAAVLAFTVADGLIVEIDILADPDRLAALDMAP